MLRMEVIVAYVFVCMGGGEGEAFLSEGKCTFQSRRLALRLIFEPRT